SFLCGSPSYALILCGRFLAGMGLSSTIILGTRTLGELFPNSSARALNLLHALIAATAALTFMTARQLAEAVDSWECSFLVTGLIALIPVSMAIFLPLKLNDFKPVSDELTEDSVDTGVKEPLKKSRWLGIDVLVLFPVVVGYVALEQSMSLFLPASVETRFGMSGSTAANMGALFWFGIILGRVTSSFLVEWIAEKRQFFWGAILMGVTLLLSLHIQNYPLMQVFVFLGGLFGGPLVPLGFATAAKQARHQGAQALIACQLSCCLGGITGPFGVGLLADNVGLVNSLSTYCALIIIAVLPLLFLMASSWLSWETVQRLLASTYKPLKSRSYEPVRPSQDRLTGYDQQAEPSTLSSHLRTHLPCEEEYASTSVTKC
ncbi:MAG: MFS transporter, partial [Planctomycetaceae bacterium]|nr:MFS transporter [Planctomycetaceae bacterium]